MGTALTGLQVSSTYNGLLKTTDNAVLSAALRVITDGLGNDSALQISTAGIASSGTFAVSGVSSFAAGAVGAPSIYLSSDTTTGFYRIGANNLGLTVSGSKVLDISSTGLAVTGAISATGNIKLANAFFLTGRNFANSTDVSIVKVNTSDELEFGSGGYASLFAGAVTMNAGLAVAGLTTTDTLRINTAPTVSVATASTHKVAVNLNGSTYYLLATT